MLACNGQRACWFCLLLVNTAVQKFAQIGKENKFDLYLISSLLLSSVKSLQEMLKKRSFLSSESQKEKAQKCQIIYTGVFLLISEKNAL